MTDATQALGFAVDCDRTLTGTDLIPDAGALQAIQELRQAGIRCILVTGRSRDDLQRFPDIQATFDAFALEGGARWGTWDDLMQTSNVNLVHEAAQRCIDAGLAIERRTASFSARLADLEVVQPLLGQCSQQVNVDRLDVVPPGMDKGLGLDGALGYIGSRGAYVVAVGDGENDIPMFERAHVGLAVANAVPTLKEAADAILSSAGPAGVIEAARRLLAGEWRPSPST